MKIFEYTKPITKAAENAKLSDIQDRIDCIANFYYATFRVYNTLVDIEREGYPISKEIEITKKLDEVNRIYRRDILNVSSDYKRENMTVFSFAGQKLCDSIGAEFGFTFKRDDLSKRKKLTYSREKLIRAAVIGLAYLFAKYQIVYPFQILATFVKILIDFFDYDSIKSIELADIYSSILNLDINVIANKIKELNLEPVAKIKKARKPKAKVELPSKKDFEYWLESGKYTQTQLKRIIADQYKVSEKTIQRKLAEYGLTRNYKNNKINN